MDTMIGVYLLLVLASSSSSPFLLAWGINEAFFNVIDYGATSDGHTDNSQAFSKAWNAACKASVEHSTLYVPPNATFLLNPTVFSGPCTTSTIYVSILGEVIAPNLSGVWDGRDASEWLVFSEINRLFVNGYGAIDGQGQAWWDQSCRYHPQLKNCTKLAPTALKFLNCNRSSITDVKFINSSQTHILVENCNIFKIHNVTIESPRNSPNTDGIHIQSSRHISITNSTIACGDDCISIGDYTSDLNINYIQCSFGHGIRMNHIGMDTHMRNMNRSGPLILVRSVVDIDLSIITSIGSLGMSGNFVQVEKINVTDCTFNETTNGARIKTWQVGRGYLKHVNFERLTFNDVENPIIIDQNYCDVPGKCPPTDTGVKISNVSYVHAAGTSASKIAININCSKSVPCHGIKMEAVELKSAVNGTKVTAKCSNAYGEEVGVEPGSCLMRERVERQRTWNIMHGFGISDLF